MPSGGDDAEDAAAPLLVPDQRHGSLYFFNVCQRLRELSCAVNFLSALFFVSESFPLKVLLMKCQYFRELFWLLGQLYVAVYLAGGPLNGVNGGGHSEEAPFAGRHEEVVGVQDRRVGQQEVLQLHMLVLAPANNVGECIHLNRFCL